jgi:hypothetical protein
MEPPDHGAADHALDAAAWDQRYGARMGPASGEERETSAWRAKVVATIVESYTLCAESEAIRLRAEAARGAAQSNLRKSMALRARLVNHRGAVALGSSPDPRGYGAR